MYMYIHVHAHFLSFFPHQCLFTSASTPLIAVHLLDIDLVLEKIGEYLRGRAETRSLWYHIVQQGPGDEEEEDI